MMRIKKVLGTTLAAAAATIGFTGGPANAMPRINRENSTYFSLRHDLRRCVSPLCGGFFVKRVNHTLTRCADGTQQPECYVAELDLEALGLDPDQAGQVSDTPEQFLLRGDVLPKVVPEFGNLGTFRASEAWRGHAGVTPAGRLFRARNNGIECITSPCLSFTAAKLNTPVTEDVAGVALDGIVADPSDGLAQLNEPEGLLLAAKRVIVTGPAGGAPALAASEFYLPFEPAAQACGSRGLPQCDTGEFCNFPPDAMCGRADAPGACVERPEVCTDVFAPVCGCDGLTHASACAANAAGVSVDFEGPCEPEPQVCGTILGLTCDKGEFCDFGVGQCNVSDAAGVCQPRPVLCPKTFAPVCGCDGRTYGNACFAVLNGAHIDFVGECGRQMISAMDPAATMVGEEVIEGEAQMMRDGDGVTLCRPRNLGCLIDPDSPTGCSNSFLRADCETVPLAPCHCSPPPEGDGPVNFACESTTNQCTCTGGGDCINMVQKGVCVGPATCGALSCTCKWKL
jgi:uncharacterized protein DUF6748/Kazal-type serine protease inhibitor-like protein